MTQDLERYIPAELAEAGVQIEDSGAFRTVTFPPELRESYNVLLPTQEIAQAVELIRPSIRAVQLDPDPENGPHFYNQGTKAKPKLAPTKQALEALAFTAGITLARTRALRREELESYDDEETGRKAFGFEATVTIRRPDGTNLEVTRSRVWQPAVEWRKVQTAKLPEWANTVEKQKAEREKRWLAEREFGPAKTESKAVLRAIRAALEIPHTFTPERASLPFIVVGYDLALDYTDPEVLRVLLERRRPLEAELYGQSEEPAALPGAQAGGDAGDSPAASTEPGAEATDGEHGPAEPEDPPAKRKASPSASPPAKRKSKRGAEPPEPKADPAPDEDAPANVLLEGEEFSRYDGQTVADVAAAGDVEYLEWLAQDDDAAGRAAKTALEGLAS